MWAFKIGYKVSFIKVDFPEPETPVTQINLPSGNFTLKFFKLFPAAPVILVGKKYFGNLMKYVENNLLADGMISPKDMDLFAITEDEDQNLEIIKNAPVRKDV